MNTIAIVLSCLLVLLLLNISAIPHFTNPLIFFSQRLKQVTKRQVDLNFENLVQRYQAKQKQQEEMAFKAK